MSSAPPNPPPRIKLSIGAARLLQAREFILANPHMSKSQITIATGLSDTTIARARRDLISEGRLIEPRNAPKPVAAQPPVVTDPVDAAPPPAKSTGKGVGMLDHVAMLELAAMVDMAVESGDDERIQKLLIKQCIVFALRSDLHPDTRMSASQMWGKLRDMAKAKDLGPGKPKTRQEAVERTRDVLVAVGPEITIEAVHLAFTVKEASNEQAQAEQADPVGGTPQATGAAGYPSGTAPADDLRQLDVAVERRQDGDRENRDLPGPATGRESDPGPPRTPTHQDGGSPWDR